MCLRVESALRFGKYKILTGEIKLPGWVEAPESNQNLKKKSSDVGSESRIVESEIMNNDNQGRTSRKNIRY